jgi:hypothetical protein
MAEVVGTLRDLTYSCEDGIATITLSRADAANAYSSAMIVGLEAPWPHVCWRPMSTLPAPSSPTKGTPARSGSESTHHRKQGATEATRSSSRAEWWRKFLALELLDNRYASLHGLRTVAVVSVIQFHVSWIFAGEHKMPLDPDWAASSFAVFFGMDLFFVLSGFLIGSILLHSLQTAGSQQLRRFYIRRIFRTFP